MTAVPTTPATRDSTSGGGRGPARSVGRHFATIWARAVGDKLVLVAVLAVYGLAIGAGVGALWPPLRDTFADLARNLPAAFDQILGGLSIGTPEGWLHAEMLSILAPGFLIAAAIISAGAATAGEEQARTLGLVLSSGVGRTTFLAAKTTAVVTHLLLVSVAMFLGMLIGNAIGDMGIGIGALASSALWVFLLGLMYAAIALTLGALLGDRRLSSAITAGVAAVSFVLATFLPLDDALTGWAKVNLWYPYSGNVPVVDGVDGGLAAVMVAVAVAVSGAGFLGFRQRADLHG